MVIFLLRLYRYPKVMLIQPFEITCISDKNTMIISKEILELRGCDALNPAKENVGVTWIDGYSVNSRQFL